MKYIRIIEFIVVISLTVYNGVSFAQAETETIPPTTIELRVNASEDLEYLIKSHVKRELERLGNVKVHLYLTRHFIDQNFVFYGYTGVHVKISYIPDWDIYIYKHLAPKVEISWRLWLFYVIMRHTWTL